MFSKVIVFGGALVVASFLLANLGFADTLAIHKGPWPIHNGHNYQPTEDQLRALHLEDVTPDQARAIDRLYDQLLPGNEKVRNRHPLSKH